MAVIEVTNLSFGYSKGAKILKSLSFCADKGEIINILGPNGCGKSTLIKALLGFFNVGKDMIRYDGVDITKISRSRMARLTSYVPQIHTGVFSYSVLEVVLMGRVSFGGSYSYSRQDYEAANSALEKVRMKDFAERSYLHLSGGERQLVIIARALAQQAEYFIMDEPVAGLDYGNQFLLLSAIKQLSKEGITIILSTHHPEHSLFLGGRSLLIKDGNIMEDGASSRIVNIETICRLYNITPSLVGQFSGVRLTAKKL
jgi:iron complex transport system ATP-binding protein